MADSTREADRAWVREQFEKYKQVQPRYALLAQTLQQIFTRAAKDDAPQFLAKAGSELRR